MIASKLITATGGSRAWRRLVASVLARDKYTCMMIRDGHPCGRPATTANHIIARMLGGSDELHNLEAACVPCNMGAGARYRGRAGENMVARHNVVIALVNVLDRHGIPHDAGRRRALAALKVHTGHPWRTADVDLACRYRRARGPLTRV